MREMDVKIILVDDHELIRKGISSTLMTNPHFKIIKDLSSGEALFPLLNDGMVPDLLLLDIVLSGISGVDVAQRVKQEYPEIKILILSSQTDEKTITDLLNIGIDGFISKSAPLKILSVAIEQVMAGESYFGKNIAKIIYDIHISKKDNSDKELTHREEEVISLSSQGLSNKEIANALNISARTVETHKANARSKLGVNNNTEMVRYAILHGIVNL